MRLKCKENMDVDLEYDTTVHDVMLCRDYEGRMKNMFFTESDFETSLNMNDEGEGIIKGIIYHSDFMRMVCSNLGKSTKSEQSDVFGDVLVHAMLNGIIKKADIVSGFSFVCISDLYLDGIVSACQIEEVIYNSLCKELQYITGRRIRGIFCVLTEEEMENILVRKSLERAGFKKMADNMFVLRFSGNE